MKKLISLLLTLPVFLAAQNTNVQKNSSGTVVGVINRLGLGVAADSDIPLLINADEAVGGGAGFPSFRIYGLNNSRARVSAENYGTNPGGGFVGLGAGGSFASPTATTSGSLIAFLGGQGFDNAGTPARTGSKALFGVVAAENWTTSAQGSYLSFQVTPTGSTTRSEVGQITSSGLAMVVPVTSTYTPTSYPAGSTTYDLFKVSSPGAGGGATTEVVAGQSWAKLTGSNNVSSLVGNYAVSEANGSGGTLASSTASFGLLYSSGAMTTTNASIFGGGVVLDSSGGISSSLSFFIAAFIIKSGAGDVTGGIDGFLAQDIGRASAASVTAFEALDQTSTIGGAKAFRGRVSSGTNRYNLYMDGTAGNYLGGPLALASYTDITSITAPAAPAASTARLYADTSGGKVRLVVRFPTGAAQVLATEP